MYGIRRAGGRRWVSSIKHDAFGKPYGASTTSHKKHARGYRDRFMAQQDLDLLNRLEPNGYSIEVIE